MLHWPRAYGEPPRPVGREALNRIEHVGKIRELRNEDPVLGHLVFARTLVARGYDDVNPRPAIMYDVH